MAGRSRTSFAIDAKTLTEIDASANRIGEQTGERPSRASVLRQALRMYLGSTAYEAALVEAHFRIGPAIRRAVGRYAKEAQERFGEIVQDELSQLED